MLGHLAGQTEFWLDNNFVRTYFLDWGCYILIHKHVKSILFSQSYYFSVVKFNTSVLKLKLYIPSTDNSDTCSSRLCLQETLD